VDVAPAPRLLWRTEVKALIAVDPVFTYSGRTTSTPSRRDTFVVTSAALTF
jgi:hypothetical protein